MVSKLVSARVCAIVLLVAVVAAAGCAAGSPAAGAGARPSSPSDSTAGPTRVVRPGAPGEPSRVLSSDDLEPVRPGYTDADVRFMQGMIPHHAQALEMTALIADRTDSEELRQLGLRIEISQRDEIELMKRWLRARGETAPTYRPMLEDGVSAGDRHLMPGMLTPDQMRQLEAARGVEFERLFLELMIGHHEGALTMVRQLFSSSGAAQEPEIFRFASDVDADQRMDIRRMNEMLEERQR